MSSISGRSGRSSGSSGGRRSTTMPTYTHQHPAPAAAAARMPLSASLELRASERLTPRHFLDKYSLPRVVRVSWLPGPQPQPLLLFRQYRSAKVQARSLAAAARAPKVQGPALVLPASYTGWFSRVNSKGQPTARCYTNIQQLVAAQITTFVTRTELTAYRLNDTKEIQQESVNKKMQYLKTSVRAGHAIKLLAVFEDVNNVQVHNNKRLSLPLIGRASSKGDKYAQCLDDKNQVVFIPLTTTGQLYAVSGLDETHIVSQLSHLLRDGQFPIRVCLVAGPLPSPLPAGFTGNLWLESCQQEDVILACTLPPDADLSCHGQFTSQMQPKFLEIDADSQFLLSRPLLHHETEMRMFKSPLLQGVLAFCREHGDRWRRQIKVTHHIFPSNETLLQVPLPASKEKAEKIKTRQATKKSASFTYMPYNGNANAKVEEGRNLPPAVPPRNESRIPPDSGPPSENRCHHNHVSPKVQQYINNKNYPSMYQPEVSSAISGQSRTASTSHLQQRIQSPPLPPPNANLRNKEVSSGLSLSPDDLPYSHVADAIVNNFKNGENTIDEENIYAEICEPKNSSSRDVRKLDFYFLKHRGAEKLKEDYYYVQFDSGSESSAVLKEEVTYDTVC
ncbi:uncharacterized protein LOC124619726 [Schistocerca americana]|uniref:uncharacterized protein LOC124619726 n=1 Tax=Schistocerca americana TaxID=7009 RepID=UPI001F4FD825|nr:uncharacterized protein LOC124619726 [Schistocerca americana]XP_047002249.1 uncharacterized protein LOC124619726 [Schistocerca americana]XP_047002250.1 uncharacterized protein LOC124619726 [Schistocerca americana]XP_049940018.1 uncharacterized protein LOC126416382 [Schistocerca serialis cubense]XP_049940019.1 uncharacterized protein LOC126416382 [Schistocerca serialis cubense]XP_049940020.1 uncharacterized protein LOC126416382 [Schistocerca serialis cubense]